MIDLQRGAARGFRIATVLAAIAASAGDFGAERIDCCHAQTSTFERGGEAFQTCEFQCLGRGHQGSQFRGFSARKGTFFSNGK
jgi:hypothetical protein